MDEFYAHSRSGSATLDDGELLHHHLSRVGSRAEQLARNATVADNALIVTAKTAGLLHDLGKYQIDWQRYLRDSVCGRPTQSVPHAIHGAAYAEHFLNHSLLAVAIAGHHAGLNDLTNLSQILENDKPTHSEFLKYVTKIALSQLPEVPSVELQAPFETDDDHSVRRLELWTRVLFSILVDADRLETERFTTRRDRTVVRLDSERVDQLRSRVAAARAEKARGKNGPLADLRNQVFEECVRAGQQDRGFFELTVPTGGGKTLSGMALALEHAKKHGMRRVIVVIPFLSIIEQNAREYREILGAENVIEHHSAVVEDEPRRFQEEQSQRTAAELATENWDAPVIVTTSVQFLETLLAASPRKCRKFHNVARSVILFDEAQLLPTHLLNPLMSVFRELVETYGCSIVFSTATQPAFRKGTGLTEGLKVGELKPILDESLVTRAFRELQRVDYRPKLDSPWDWGKLVTEITDSTDAQGLCVLNTRKQAREVWEALRKIVQPTEAVVHLSSAMCAEHRSDILGRPNNAAPDSVRGRLKSGRTCWLVSTQVIEAGVDVDFPRVFRALGPLDSIIQVGGRCNREGRLTDANGNPRRGDVVIFQPADEGIPPGLYQTATGKARTFLQEYTSEQLATDQKVFERYFSELYGVAHCDPHDIQLKRAAFAFRTVGDLARVIANSGTPVIVPYKRGKKWIRRIQRDRAFSWSILRRLQRYTVNLRPNDLRNLQELGAVRPLLGDDGPLVLHESAYDPYLGVVIRGLSLEDFLQFDLEV